MSLSFKRNYSGFSPKDFGPALWLDDTGSDAGEWVDKSGNGLSATQTDPAKRPQIITNALNGRQVRRFNGSTHLQYLTPSNLLRNVSGASLFCVRKWTVSPQTGKFLVGVMVNGDLTRTRAGLAGGATADKSYLLARRNDGDSVARIDSINNVGSLYAIDAGVINYSSQSAFLYRNGFLEASSTSFLTSGNTSDTQSSGYYVGGGISSADFWMVGDIAEIIVYPRALTQFERQVVEGYLSVKWGIPVSSSLAPSIKVGQSFDSDASAYFSRIVSAGSSITRENMVAIDQFIRGCKADGIWNAIKASCLLCGADTLTGALVPLVGPAPTNIGFVAGDYSRTTGLKGDGSKVLDSNRNNNEDPQNSHHLAAWVTQADTTTVPNPALIGTGGFSDAESVIGYDVINLWYFFRSRQATSSVGSSVSRTTGLHAISRYDANNVAVLLAGFTSSVSQSSQTPRSSTIKVFARDQTPYWNGRVSFYSIGENINLTALNNRLSILMASLT